MMADTPEKVARPSRRRVFFALWPDDGVRSSLVRATRNAVRLSRGQPIAKDRLHLTVAFLGELTEPRLELARAALPVNAGAFDLTLDTVGVWPQSRVLWVAASAPPPALDDLEQRLWDALEERGFVAEERVYRPHVTLARRAQPTQEAVEPVLWRVTDIALVESLPAGRGVHYEVLERWPL